MRLFSKQLLVIYIFFQQRFITGGNNNMVRSTSLMHVLLLAFLADIYCFWGKLYVI